MNRKAGLFLRLQNKVFTGRLWSACFFILQGKIKTKKSVKSLYKGVGLCYNSNRKNLREKGGAYSAESVSDFGERYYFRG